MNQTNEPVLIADKMREDFEAWMINKEKIIIGSNDPYPQGLEKTYWRIWQAATAETTAKIAQMQTELEAYRTMQRTDNSQVIANMQARIDELVDVLIPAKEKLQIYREHSTGEYQGGMEYTQLVNLIDEAIAKVKDEV